LDITNVREIKRFVAVAPAMIAPSDPRYQRDAYVLSRDALGFTRRRNTNWSPPHDVNGKNAALMTRKKIVDEVANNGIGFVSRLRDDATDERSTSRMPFQIDCGVCVFAVNFRPTVRTSRTHVLGGNQIKASKLGIIHDLFPQRSASAHRKKAYE